jgi:hypothetical protein
MGGTTSLLTPLINYEALVLWARLKKCQLMKGVYVRGSVCFTQRVSQRQIRLSGGCPRRAACEYYYI